MDGSIPFNQGGFRRNRGCSESGFLLQSIDEWHVKRSKGFIAVFLDIKKAFDSVPFGVVCHVLKMQKLPLMVVKFLVHWISGHSKRLVSNGSVGRLLRVGCGTPQGSVLSPFLFNCVMNSLSCRLRGESCLFLPALVNSPPSLRLEFDSGELDVNHLLYADDTTLLASSFENAQKLLDIASEWSKAVGMTLRLQSVLSWRWGKKTSSRVVDEGRRF